MADADKIVHSSHVFQTKNYDKFKLTPGNRDLDEGHVRRLAKKIEREGNLTEQFPITVNENMEVIDGQNRLAALKSLGYPVFYEIKKGLNVNSIISINTGQKNWTWRDFAKSFAKRGNVNYQQLLQLMEETGETRFGVLYSYATLGGNPKGGTKTARSLRDAFNNGEFVMKNFTLSLKLLGQYQELAVVANVNMLEFAYAALRFMRTPDYNHEYMIDKIASFGEPLRSCYTLHDFLDALEEVQLAS